MKKVVRAGVSYAADGRCLWEMHFAEENKNIVRQVLSADV